MFDRRLPAHQNWLSLFPFSIILLIIATTVGTALTPGLQPKEAVFDLFMRLSARDQVATTDNSPVIIAIDEESTARIGPWPWPRTTLARLAQASEEAEAAATILTVDVDGPDPYSPEILAKLWADDSNHTESISTSLSALPDSDIFLANALEGAPSAIAIGRNSNPLAKSVSPWARTEIKTDWLTLPPSVQTPFVALPKAIPLGPLPQKLQNATLVSVNALPADQDGVVRRARPLWNAYEMALPASYLSGLILAGHDITVIPHTSLSHSAGRPIQEISLAGYSYSLDRYSAIRFYPPKNISIPTIPAWRVLEGDQNWTRQLKNQQAFIGLTLPHQQTVSTARGALPLVQFHGLMADQIAVGAEATRPEWAGLAEAGLALLLGVAAVMAVIFLPPLLAISASLMSSFLVAVLCWLFFKQTGFLLDPVPTILAMIGGQITLYAAMFVNSIFQDDKVRAAFHGSLPISAMQKLQSRNHFDLLDGVRRQITVLSCSVRLPDDAYDRFLDNPDEYVQFRARTNDKLRQVILDLDGTVDYSEDGRLLGYWNAPEERKDHIEKACSCALLMIESISVLAENLQSSQLAETNPDMVSRDKSLFEESILEIGISSDVCYAGPVGRGVRNRYSAIGPAISYANLLRNRTKLYGPAIIVDERVFSGLRHKFAFLDLDNLLVNDDTIPRPIYGLVGNPFLKASKAYRLMSDTQRTLVNAWREGDIAKAKAALEQLKDIPGVHHSYIDLYTSRIDQAERQARYNRRKEDKWTGGEHVFM
ncbi:MAG: CHASE2 domain-containing protein [bacterium]